MNAASVRALLNAAEAVARDAERAAIEAERRRTANRLWSAMMLTAHVDVCAAILRGQPVLVDRLDPEALRRALRGALPPPSEFITLTSEQLDALSECGPIHPKDRRRAV